jgi:hypothetical protein
VRRLWSLFTKSRRDAEPRLADVLAQPIPQGAEDTPLDIRPAWAGQIIWRLAHLAHLPIVFGILSFWGWARLTPLIAAVFLALLGLSVVEIMLWLRTAVRRVAVNEHGVRVERAFGHDEAPWYAITRIAARDDLSALRIDLPPKSITISSATLTPAQRIELAMALRARLVRRGGDVERWLGSWRQQVTNGASAIVGTAVALGVVFFGPHASNSALGFRCSGPSDYLQERFGTPLRNGCTVLGVAGAAERAGLRQGDLVIAWDGVPITSGPQFAHVFDDKIASGDGIFTFTVLRGGDPEPLHIDLTMGPGGAIELPDDDPVRWFLEARRDQGQHPPQNIEDYSRAIELAPDFDLAYLYRGNLYHDLGDFNAGQQDYTTALNLNWENGEAHREEALVQFDLSQRSVDPDARRDFAAQATYQIDLAIQFHECDLPGAFVGSNYDCAYDYQVKSEMLYASTKLEESVSTGARAIDFYPSYGRSYAKIA